MIAGRLLPLSRSDLDVHAAAGGMLPIVRALRTARSQSWPAGFRLPGCDKLDLLFAELLARGATDIASDAAHLQRALDGDADFAAALFDEYVAAYAAAVATVHHFGIAVRMDRIWPPTTALVEPTVTLFARDVGAMLRSDSASVARFPPSYGVELYKLHLRLTHDARNRSPSTRRSALDIERAIEVGHLHAIEHDIFWHKMKRGDAIRLVQQSKRRRGGKASEASIRAMMRRNHDIGLGLHSVAARRGKKKWAAAVSTTLWFDRLKPLHPPMLDPVQLRAFEKIRPGLLEEDAKAAMRARERAEKKIRASLRAPKREQIELRLTGELRELARRLLPKPRSRLSVDDVVVGVLAVALGVPWEHFPKDYRLASGNTIRKALRTWQKTGTWRRFEPELAKHFSDADFSLLAPSAYAGRPRRPRRRVR